MFMKSPRIDFTIAFSCSGPVICWFVRRSSSGTCGNFSVNADSMRVVSYDRAGLLVRPLSASNWGFLAMIARMLRAMRNESRRPPMQSFTSEVLGHRTGSAKENRELNPEKLKIASARTKSSYRLCLLTLIYYLILRL